MGTTPRTTTLTTAVGRRRRRRARAAAAPDRARVMPVEAELLARGRALGAANTRLRESAARERRTARRLAGLARTALARVDTETVEELIEVVLGQGMAAIGADGCVLAVREDVVRLRLAVTHGLPSAARGKLTLFVADIRPPATAGDGAVLLPDRVAGLALHS